jgi:hypothetical protein
MKHRTSKIVCVFKLLRPIHPWWKKAVNSAFVRTTRGCGIGENWKLKEKMYGVAILCHALIRPVSEVSVVYEKDSMPCTFFGKRKVCEDIQQRTICLFLFFRLFAQVIEGACK